MSSPSRSWDEMLDTLSTLIAFKNRADGNNWRDAFENMGVYLERLDMTEDIKKLRVIHVAGTKGKGSTCAMVEAMLRQCGYRTGLYTSPHLIDVRERVRIDGRMADKAVFEEQFWWCYRRFQAASTPEVGVPGYFRFMTLLALKIFLAQGVDVVVLEVGLGGRLDATNIVHPTVCGITSLGMDHMEVLGDTLAKIAREKGGILKACCPGWTVEQPEEAMEALQGCADKAGTSLHVVGRLDQLRSTSGSAPSLSLGGDHMLVNAGLAVRLASEWERRSEVGQAPPGAAARLALLDQGVLPEEYERGLASVQWPGRSQVVEDEALGEGPGQEGGSSATLASSSSSSSSGGSGSRLSFFLDGAHTPESMAVCADWFADQATSRSRAPAGGSAWDVRRVLLFNCMKERDPAVLLPVLSQSLAARGLHFHQALFVPPDSQHGFLPTSNTAAPPAPAQDSTSTAAQVAGAAASSDAPGSEAVALPDLSWQAHMQQVWESQSLGQPGHKQPSGAAESNTPSPPPLPMPTLTLPSGASRSQDPWNGAVIPSLSCTLEWLRQYARATPRLQVQVLVSGSLYLVGDMLRLLGKVPK